MTAQPSLFDAPPPHSEPTTPLDAAVTMVNGAAVIRERVYEHLAGVDGATEQEMEFALALHGNTLRPRLWELEGNHGFPVRIAKTDERRLNLSGRSARVYRVVV